MRLSNSSRVLLHVPLGMGTAAMCIASPVMASIFAAVFTIYELNEDSHDRKDQAWVDLKGFLLGFAVGGVLYGIYFVIRKGVWLPS